MTDSVRHLDAGGSLSWERRRTAWRTVTSPEGEGFQPSPKKTLSRTACYTTHGWCSI